MFYAVHLEVSVVLRVAVRLVDVVVSKSAIKDPLPRGLVVLLVEIRYGYHHMARDGVLAADYATAGVELEVLEGSTVNSKKQEAAQSWLPSRQDPAAQGPHSRHPHLVLGEGRLQEPSRHPTLPLT